MTLLAELFPFTYVVKLLKLNTIFTSFCSRWDHKSTQGFSPLLIHLNLFPDLMILYDVTGRAFPRLLTWCCTRSCLNWNILCIPMWSKCLELNVSGLLRLFQGPILGGTRTSGTNSLAGNGLILCNKLKGDPQGRCWCNGKHEKCATFPPAGFGMVWFYKYSLHRKPFWAPQGAARLFCWWLFLYSTIPHSWADSLHSCCMWF